MRYDTIKMDHDGGSHFGAVDVEMTEAQYAPPALPFLISKPVDVQRSVFFTAPVGWVGESHPTPRRQFYVGLAGELDVAVSSGETKRFGPGSVILLEDTEGAGHISTVVGDTDVVGLFVHLE